MDWSAHAPHTSSLDRSEDRRKKTLPAKFDKPYSDTGKFHLSRLNLGQAKLSIFLCSEEKKPPTTTSWQSRRKLRGGVQQVGATQPTSLHPSPLQVDNRDAFAPSCTLPHSLPPLTKIFTLSPPSSVEIPHTDTLAYGGDRYLATRGKKNWFVVSLPLVYKMPGQTQTNSTNPGANFFPSLRLFFSVLAWGE